MLQKQTSPLQKKLLNPLVFDYLSGKQDLKLFYNYFPDTDGFRQAVSSMDYGTLDRTSLVKELNRQAGLVKNTSAASLANIALLKNNETFTVTTGHQLCLFTGPLYFVYKIFSVINLCETLKKEFPDHDFVPAYWMASEDHDFAEVNHLHLFGKTIEWQSAQTGAVGGFSTIELEALAAPLAEVLGKSDHAAYLTDLFKRSYLQHQSLADATRYLVNELFGSYGIVIVDGQSAELKKQFNGSFKKDIFDNLPYKKVSETIGELTAIDYGIQVNPREINCFYTDGSLRARFEKEGKSYKVVGTQNGFSKAELEKMIDNDPLKISPNVVLRPAYQQCILPNIAYVGGLGELAYWLEYKAMFDELKLNFPVLMPRKSVYLIDQGAKQKMEKLGLSFDELTVDEQSLVKQYLEKTNKTVDLSAYKTALEDVFTKISEDAVSVDKTLAGAVEAEKQKGLNSVSNIEAKMNKAIKLRSETELNQVKGLRSKLFPADMPQERYDNFGMYYVKWGPELMSALKINLEYDLETNDPILLIESQA